MDHPLPAPRRPILRASFRLFLRLASAWRLPDLSMNINIDCRRSRTFLSPPDCAAEITGILFAHCYVVSISTPPPLLFPQSERVTTLRSNGTRLAFPPPARERDVLGPLIAAEGGSLPVQGTIGTLYRAL